MAVQFSRSMAIVMCAQQWHTTPDVIEAKTATGEVTLQHLIAATKLFLSMQQTDLNDLFYPGFTAAKRKKQVDEINHQTFAQLLEMKRQAQAKAKAKAEAETPKETETNEAAEKPAGKRVTVKRR